MSEPVPIEAGWAVWSKRARSNDDYSVLSCSTRPFSRSNFAAIVSRFAPGNPSVRRRGQGALPWVTLSWVGVDDGLHLGIAVQDSTDEVDGAGRPITQTSYFCVPYTPLIEHPISYVGLYEKVSKLRLPLEDGGPISLAVPLLDPQQLAQTIEEFGEMVVASTAGLLLHGPVSIVQSETSTLDERLCFLDAVAALLPYGYRTKYTAATWADSGTRHQIRLAFAERPRQDACPVVWRAAGEVSASTPAARSYLAQLSRLRGRSADSSLTFELPGIVAHLASQTEPQKFDLPQYAIASLRTVDLPFAVLAAVRNEAADQTEVRLLFSNARVTELPSDGRGAMLAQLISYGEAQDRPLIQQWWDEIAPANGSVLLPTVTSTCRRLLWALAPSQLAGDLVGLAAHERMDDELLADLILPPVDPALLLSGLPAAARLFNEAISAAGGITNLPRTLSVLPSNPALVCEMAAQLVGSGQDSNLSRSWLRRAMPELLAPFVTVLAERPRAVDVAAIDRLSGYSADCVRALLQAASYAGRLCYVLPGVVRWLTARPDMALAERNYWRHHIVALAPRHARDRAHADLALLAVGAPPSWLLTMADQPDWRAYASCFVAEWPDRGSHRGAGAGERFAATLSRYLDEQPWALSYEHAKAVVSLTRNLTDLRYRPAFVGVVASVLAAVPGGMDWEFAERWLTEMERARPGIIQSGALSALRSLPPGVSPDRIVALAERSFFDGVPAGAAGLALVRSGALEPVTPGVDVLAVVRLALGLDDSADQGDSSWLRRLTVVAGPNVLDLASGSQQGVLRSIPGRLGRLIGLTDRGGASSEGRQPELTEQQRKILEQFRDWADEFMKSAKKGGNRKRSSDPAQPRGKHPTDAAR
jgi:hypothetical protein